MIFWLVETNFFHFLRQRSTAASGNSSFFNWNTFFSQSFIPAGWNEFFCLLGTVLFYSELFFLVESIFESWGKSVFKDEMYSCSWTPVFSIFSEVLRFFKVEATLAYCGNAFSSKSFIRLMETDFLYCGNSGFWSELFFC